MQTIFALATARGKSGVAIMRISGPAAHDIGRLLAGSLPLAGRSALRALRDRHGEFLDQALVLSFESPRSFTGEDVVELQIHGSIAVIRALEVAIAETGLARMAEPGEFTRRALLNGHLDLAQVEGLADLIAAETELQRKQAQQLFSGGMRVFADQCRTDLVRAIALVEVTIDFADEDVPVDVAPEVGLLLENVLRDIRRQLAGYRHAERVRNGFEVAVIGPPNAGKSTFINKIAGRDIAITSDIPGTTRDVLEVRVDLAGLPVTFLDTAGLRHSADKIERLGVARARSRALEADLRILLIDGLTDDGGFDASMPVDLIYRSKADLTGVGISARTGDGIDAVLADVERILSDRVSGMTIASHERHRLALDRADVLLQSAITVFRGGDVGAEILAVHLRDVVTTLDSLIGRVDVEAVLGEIFSEFCIGK